MVQEVYVHVCVCVAIESWGGRVASKLEMRLRWWGEMVKVVASGSGEGACAGEAHVSI